MDEPRSVRVEVRIVEEGEDATVPWAIGRDPHERLVAPHDVATHVAHLRLHAELRSDAAVAVDAHDIRPTVRVRAVRALPVFPWPNAADYGARAAQTTYAPSWSSARSTRAASSTTWNWTPPTVCAAAVYIPRSFGQLTTK